MKQHVCLLMSYLFYFQILNAQSVEQDTSVLMMSQQMFDNHMVYTPYDAVGSFRIRSSIPVMIRLYNHESILITESYGTDIYESFPLRSGWYLMSFTLKIDNVLYRRVWKVRKGHISPLQNLEVKKHVFGEVSYGGLLFGMSTCKERSFLVV